MIIFVRDTRGTHMFYYEQIVIKYAGNVRRPHPTMDFDLHTGA